MLPIGTARSVTRCIICAALLRIAGITYTREDTGYPTGERVAAGWPPIQVYRLGRTVYVLSISYWLPFAALRLLPAARAVMSLRRRTPLRVCRSCGYDLRASPGRCPECGEVPTRRHT